jgi:hypothetical protein
MAAQKEVERNSGAVFSLKIPRRTISLSCSRGGVLQNALCCISIKMTLHNR